MFITTILQASQAAIRNHQEEKLEALRNAVLNSALPGAPAEDLQFMFVRYIDELTPWHLSVLKFFDDPLGWSQKRREKIVTIPTTNTVDVLEAAFPALGENRAFCDQVVNDLDNRSLTNAGDWLHVTATAKGALAPKTTDMGKQFLQFIVSPHEKER